MANKIYDVNGNQLNIAGSSSAKELDYTDIIFTIGYLYVRNDNGMLKLSIDGGSTWTKSINVSSIGLIKNIYVFKDLTLNVFTHTKAYYSDDWSTLHESTVLDADGSTYVPSATDTFTVTKTQADRTIIDGVEMYVFGNYNITNENSSRKLIWYTKDSGHTYKVAYEFNIKGHRSIRHTHTVKYCEYDGTFWICTGDSASQSYVFKGTYDMANDSWSFADVGHSLDYKWASLQFYGDRFYYCYDNTPAKVMSGKFGDEYDISKQVAILEDLPNDAIGLFIGSTGDMLVTLSIYRTGTSTSPNTAPQDCRRMYYSSDRVSFTEIMGSTLSEYNDANTIYYFFYGPNADGKILASLFSPTHENLADCDKVPSVFLDDMVRKAGFPNAFIGGRPMLYTANQNS